jgi:hypothetical protein
VNYGDEIQFAGVSCRLVEPGVTPPHEHHPSDGNENALGRCIRPTPESAAEARAAISEETAAKWKPPISKLYLSGGLLALFAIVTALATQVC